MLASLRVRNKLLVLLAVPLTALLLIASTSALEKWQTLKAMDGLSSLVDMAIDTGSLIHELQKERGYSAGYISSKGTLFQSEVMNQRRAQATARERLANRLTAFKTAFPQVRLGGQFESVVRQTGGLGPRYQRFDSFEAPATEAITLYSGLIDELQSGLNDLLDHGKDATLYGHTVSLIALISGKEFAGQERALLNTALSAGHFPSPEIYRRWTQRVALQEDRIANFLQHVPQARQSSHVRLMERPKADVEAMRQKVLASLEAPRLDGNAPAWFAASTRYIDSLHEIEQATSTDLKQYSLLLRNTAARELVLTLGIGAAIVLLTLLLAFFIVRDITIPLSLTVTFARAVADGRHDATLALRRGDEFGQLAATLRTMLESLKQLIAKADEATRLARDEAAKAHEATLLAAEAQHQAEKARQEGMHAAAEQLSGVVNVLTQASGSLDGQVKRAQNDAHLQADRLAETAVAMEEMNVTVLEVTQNSANAASMADAAREQAERGQGMVQGVVQHLGQSMTRAHELKTGMARLGSRVGEIGKVLGVISDIADQTNLLALNAAIEAARAGEAGRGFAVVADEVRKLAEKTMLATGEVARAITAIQSDTGQTIDAMEQTVVDMERVTASAETSGEALREIVRMVDCATDQIRSIATASKQQATTSEEINRSVGEVNTIAHNTTDAMTASARSVDDLNRQVRELDGLMKALRTS